MNNLELLHVATAAILGLLIGSFLNVCIYRIPRDLSVVSPRSFCPECENQIVWYHNIPVVSYAVLRGRCGTCRKPIALRYPLVELTTAVLFALVAVRYGWTLAAFKWALFEALAVVLFWTDMEERILPDEFTIGGTVAGLVLAFFVPVHGAVLDLLLVWNGDRLAICVERGGWGNSACRSDVGHRRVLSTHPQARGTWLGRRQADNADGKLPRIRERSAGLIDRGRERVGVGDRLYSDHASEHVQLSVAFRKLSVCGSGNCATDEFVMR